MTIKTTLINSATPNRGVKPQDFEVNLIGTAFLTAGFLPHPQTDANLICSENGIPDMTVNVGAKSYLVEVERAGNPAPFTKFKALVHILGEETLTIPENSSGGSLVGAVILRIDKTAIASGATPSDTGLIETTLEFLVGTSNTALIDSEISTEIGGDFFVRLANVTVPDSSVEITDSEIQITATQTGSTVFIDTSSNQTITGVKTFENSPIVPTPTTDMQAATKKYIDDKLATISGGNYIEFLYSVTGQTTPGAVSNTITHNLGVTQADVEAGKYVFMVFGTSSNSWTTLGNLDYFYKPEWNAGTPTALYQLFWQANTLKFYSNTSYSNISLLILKMF